MSSKVKDCKAYIVHHRGRSTKGFATIFGRYCVGAKNEREAEEFLRREVGKHAKVRVYYKDKNRYMPYGMVIREC